MARCADRLNRMASGRVRLLASVALLALSLGACKQTSPEVTGSIGPVAAAPASEEAWRNYAQEWGARYDQKPGDKTVALNYARALRVLGQRQQAVAVLQSAAIKFPKDNEVLAAYGKALAENGDLRQAQTVLAQAHTPERPDWRILSAQGAVADQLGDHVQAQNLYETALKIQPDDPSVLSNLGLSYALSGKLGEAEKVLIRAADSPSADVKTRQNLALVLSLEGKFSEAEQVARKDMTPVEAAQSIASIRQMVSQPNSWKTMQKLDARKQAQASQPKSNPVVAEIKPAE